MVMLAPDKNDESGSGAAMGCEASLEEESGR